MPGQSASSTKSPTRRKTDRLPTGKYLFFITGLATFLLALVLGLGLRPTQPVEAVIAPVTHRIPATVNGQAPQRPTADPARQEALAAWVRDAANVQRAVGIVQQQEPDLSGEVLSHSLAKNLYASWKPNGPDNSKQLVISYRGRTAGCARVVNELAELVVQWEAKQAEQPARERLFQAQQNTEAAKRKALAIHKRYEEFIAARDADLPSKPAQPASRTGGDLASAQPVPAMIENPAWRELADQQRRLSQRRLQLAEQMTIEHPVMRQLDVDLAQLDKQLSQFPRLIENPDAGSTTSELTAQRKSPQPSREQAPDAQPADAERSAVARLKLEWETAEQLALEEQAKLQQASTALEAALADRLEVKRWAAAPRLVRGSDAVTLIVAGLLAWVVASYVATRTVTENPTMVSEGQAEAVLALPVVAVLPAGEHSPLEFLPKLPLTPRLARRASEVVLAASLFVALMLLVLDDGFRSGLFSEPLSALPLGIDRLREMMQS